MFQKSKEDQMIDGAFRTGMEQGKHMNIRPPTSKFYFWLQSLGAVWPPAGTSPSLLASSSSSP